MFNLRRLVVDYIWLPITKENITATEEIISLYLQVFKLLQKMLSETQEKKVYYDKLRILYKYNNSFIQQNIDFFNKSNNIHKDKKTSNEQPTLADLTEDNLAKFTTSIEAKFPYAEKLKIISCWINNIHR